MLHFENIMYRPLQTSVNSLVSCSLPAVLFYYCLQDCVIRANQRGDAPQFWGKERAGQGCSTRQVSHTCVLRNGSVSGHRSAGELGTAQRRLAIHSTDFSDEKLEVRLWSCCPGKESLFLPAPSRFKQRSVNLRSVGSGEGGEEMLGGQDGRLLFAWVSLWF